MIPLSLDTLVMLDAIDRKGSFAAAAAELHRVPSALTYSVQKAEEAMGVSFFRREGRRAALTEAGRHLLENGRELLIASSQLVDSTVRVAQGWEPRFSIAVDTVVDLNLVYSLLDCFYGVNPEVIINLYEESLTGTLDALVARRADLAIGVDPNSLPEGIRSRHFADLEMVLAVAPDHPLAEQWRDQQRPLSREALAEHRAVVARDSTRNLAARTVWLQPRQRTLTVDRMRDKIAAQVAGLGIGRLPRHMIADHIAAGRLVQLPELEPSPPEPLHIAWRNGDRGKTLDWFRTALCKVR